jgi:hypothetical protein
MAATIVVIKTHGALGYETESQDTTFGLKSVDDHATAPADAPVSIPDIGTNYSYECWMRFKCTVAPSNTCENFKVWGSGAAVETDLVITVNSDAVNTYATPVNTDSAAGTRVDFATKGSGAKISVAGDLVNIGDKTDFSIFQLEVDPLASPGDMADQTVYYSYDES